MTTDRAAGPVVRQIERTFRERIESGELRPGHRLASRAEMAADLGVSTGTVALAIRRLRESGHVTSDTSGVYVADAGPRGAGGAERARRSISEGKIYPEGEAARVLSSALT